jgi:hypothetical protein
MRALRLIALASLLVFGLDCRGSDERITLRQDASGTVTATLDGNAPYCAFNFVDSQATISGGQVIITSTIALPACPPPPPGFPTTVPYGASVTLGTLPDGVYVLTWQSQWVSGPPPGFQFRVQAAFSVLGGALVLFSPFATPSLSEVALLLLVLLVGASGMRIRRPGIR